MDIREIGEAHLSPIDHLDNTLTVSHSIGANIDSVKVQLLNTGCKKLQPQFSSTASVSIDNDHFDTSTLLANYDIIFEPDLFEHDSGGFVSLYDESSGSVEFCTRVFSNLEQLNNNGTIQDFPINYLETNFKFDFTRKHSKTNDNNGLERHLIRFNIEEKTAYRNLQNSGDYELKGCQCKDFICMRYSIGETDPLITCVHPVFPEEEDWVVENYSVRVSDPDGYHTFSVTSVSPFGVASPAPNTNFTEEDDLGIRMVTTPIPLGVRKMTSYDLNVTGWGILKEVDTNITLIMDFQFDATLAGECTGLFANFLAGIGQNRLGSQ